MIRVSLAITQLAILAFAGAGWAHPILVHNGAIEWNEEKLTLTLVPDEHSLDHEIAPLASNVTHSAVARRLARSIVLVSHDCRSFLPQLVTVSDNGELVVSDYSIPADIRVLAVRHNPIADLAALARQIQLRWSPDPNGFSQLLRLTSAGNHVVIIRNDSAVDNLTYDPFNEPVVSLEYASHDSSVAVNIDFPCRLLTTWPTLLPMEGQSLQPGTLSASGKKVGKWARQMLSIAAAGGARTECALGQIQLLDPLGKPIPETSDECCSLYTTRVRVCFNCSYAKEAAWTEITWSGFNAAVLAAQVIRLDGREPQAIGRMTATQSTIRFTSGPPLDVTIK